MSIYYQRIQQGQKGGKSKSHNTQSTQRLTSGSMHLDRTEFLSISMDSSYRLSVSGGIYASSQRGDRLVQVSAIPGSHGGQLHFQSLKAGEPDVRIEVYFH